MVCKSENVPEHYGKYPRVGWVDQRGGRITKWSVKYKHIHIWESPQYKFIMGDKSYYTEYMKLTGWRTGYGPERRAAIKNFERLIQDFDMKKIKIPECVYEDGKFVLVDGLHRCSIIYSKNPKTTINIKIIYCPSFNHLRLIE